MNGTFNHCIHSSLNWKLFYSQKALVGHENSQQFHVFELTRQLPKFSMYAIREELLMASKMDGKVVLAWSCMWGIDVIFFFGEHFISQEIPLDETSYAEFRINERFQRICLWINQVCSLCTNGSVFSCFTSFARGLFVLHKWERVHLHISLTTHLKHLECRDVGKCKQTDRQLNILFDSPIFFTTILIALLIS